MRIFNAQQVDARYISLIENLMHAFGDTKEMTINFLIAEQFSQSEIDVWRLLIDSESKNMNRLTAIAQFEQLIFAMLPYVNKSILRAGVWSIDKLHMLYVDPSEGTMIHQSSASCPDPTRIA